MPAQYTYPGVYVEEIPSGVHPIAGVSTSETAFVDTFARGPVEDPKRVTSFEEFEAAFGGLSAGSEASYGIHQYFMNGGGAAWIVRVTGDGGATSTLALTGGLTVNASSEGAWGDNVQVGVVHEPPAAAEGEEEEEPEEPEGGEEEEEEPEGGEEEEEPAEEPAAPAAFTLVVREVAQVGSATQVVASEVYTGLNLTAGDPRNAVDVVNRSSRLVQLVAADDATRPPQTGTGAATSATALRAPVSAEFTPLDNGADGGAPTQTQIIDGVESLDTILPFIFNILCLPGAAALGDTRAATYDEAAEYCRDKRAFLIVDPPPDATRDTILDAKPAASENAAIYYPRVEIPDPLTGGLPRRIGPSGTVAGIYARTDTARGVWKAPAGTEAAIGGVTLVDKLTDEQNGQLNIMGVNVLRSFPIYGNVVWGARTLKGADMQASEWKYVPVRRTALYIEESLYQGLKWVVFEPNDEPLWSQIRLNVGSFMHSLFRQGAFAGGSPRDAYFVKCDKDTTTQADVDRGIVNIVVGFKPLKPAEFVVLRIQQIAGQIET
jgi:uncharacterized protein